MESLTSELLSLVLGKEVQSFDPNIIIDDKDIRGHSYLMVVLKDDIDQRGISVAYVTDHIGRLCKEWMIGDTNEIINTFNSSSGWVCTSSIYNRREIGKTELEAVLKLANYIAIERTTTNPLVGMAK